MSEDLRDKITTAIDRAEQVARAAQQGSNEGIGIRFTRDDGGRLWDHIALNDPAAVLRRCAADRRVLERHAPHHRYNSADPECSHCWTPREELADWPCDEVRDLADRYGIEAEA